MLEFDHVRRDISGSLESSASRRRPLREEAQYTEACERPKQHFTRTRDLRSMKTNVIMFPCCHPALNAPCSTEDDTRVPIEAHFTRYLSQSTTALFRRRRGMPFARAIATASRCPTHSYELSSRYSRLMLNWNVERRRSTFGARHTTPRLAVRIGFTHAVSLTGRLRLDGG